MRNIFRPSAVPQMVSTTRCEACAVLIEFPAEVHLIETEKDLMIVCDTCYARATSEDPAQRASFNVAIQLLAR